MDTQKNAGIVEAGKLLNMESGEGFARTAAKLLAYKRMRLRSFVEPQNSGFWTEAH